VIEVPFDQDIVEFVLKRYAKRATLMDKIEIIRKGQNKQAHEYSMRLERMREARLSLADGSNEIVNDPQWPASIMQRTKRRELESLAEDPPMHWYTTRVRIWLGEYGYDRTGTFHNGTCARAWGTAVALDLRKKGKL
jgi:hypothetical protein